MASFEERLTALEVVLERLERGEFSLEETMRLFEEGVMLANSCKAEIEAAEGRIQVLTNPKTGAAQDLVLEPDDGSATYRSGQGEDEDEEY